VTFSRALHDPGLTDLKLATTGAHGRLTMAVQTLLVGVPWQRYKVHLTGNVTGA
jgi:transposase-like protein